MLRLSVTDLESIRYWKASEDSTPEDLIRRLAHVEPPSRQMLAGRALAKFFENARVGQELETTTVEGWGFAFEFDHAVPLEPLREMKAEMPFTTPSGPVVLVGKADGCGVTTIRDQKLTEKFDAENYLDSLQWRAYLVMFDCNRFVYDVFVGKYHDGEEVVTIREYHEMPFYAYPGITVDVQRAVNEAAELYSRYAREISVLKGTP